MLVVMFLFLKKIKDSIVYWLVSMHLISAVGIVHHWTKDFSWKIPFDAELAQPCDCSASIQRWNYPTLSNFFCTLFLSFSRVKSVILYAPAFHLLRSGKKLIKLQIFLALFWLQCNIYFNYSTNEFEIHLCSTPNETHK